MRKISFAALFVLTLILIVGCTERTENRELDYRSEIKHLLVQKDLNPQGFTWDGKNFWTAHEPGWEMDDEIKPGHPKYQAYLFKHTNDENKTITESYAFPHHYNVIGLQFINGELWASSWINRSMGRIYRYKIENSNLIETGSWDTEISCDGLTWDGSYLWCNMAPRGIVKFNITTGVKEVKRYPLSKKIKSIVDGETHAKGIAWDGKNIWTAYKFTNPIIVKHNMDENLSFAEGYQYADELLSSHAGDIVFVNGTFYSSSSDPGTKDLRGGRIIQHKFENNQLLIDKIYYYNNYK